MGSPSDQHELREAVVMVNKPQAQVRQNYQNPTEGHQLGGMVIRVGWEGPLLKELLRKGD